MIRLPSLITAFVILILINPAFAADWPQYRHDAGRGAASAQTLPESLHLLWTRELPAPQPAFPMEIRLRYDATYQPVVMGKTMFVPSMVTDSVTALDTETGRQRWQCFAEGPVRLAPVAWQDKVYFVSDDGYLYCVGAADGKLRWKFRGLPDDGEDRKVMGNGRLVSIFPARGGPVLADGVIYFAAGIWSGEGVFVHAVNATTGKAVWSNTDSDRIAKANADHGIATYAGISPQGHLAIVNDTLVVPCGAQLPALLDLKTGKLRTYTMGWGGRIGLPKGCSFVCGIDKYLMHAGDLYDMGRKDPSRPGYDAKQMTYLGALTRVQVERANQKALGEFREPVLTPQAMYYQQNGITAYDLTKPNLRKRSDAKVPDFRKDDKYPDPLTVAFPELWKLQSKSKVHIKTGNHLYAGAKGSVEAIAIPAGGQEPKISWRGQVEGTPQCMLAADDKLFVVTDGGRIYAFGGFKPAQTAVHGKPGVPSVAAEPWARKAADLLKATGTDEGYILVLGLENARLAEALVAQSRCSVIVIDEDAEKVATVRTRLRQAGLYGTRVSVLVGDPASCQLPPYMANLILAADADVAAKAGDPAFIKRVFRSLRPYGGKACLTADAVTRLATQRQIDAGELPGGALRQQDDLLVLSRQSALADTGNWSHAGANAANTGASQDRFLKAPLTRLWFNSAIRWNRKPGRAWVRVAGGRILVKSGRLHAIDAYTGRHLWQVSLPPSNGQFVAFADAIYVTRGNTCDVLDPANGKKRGEIVFPGDEKGGWSHLRITNDVMVGASGNRLVCLDRKSQRVLWQHETTNNVKSVAVGNGKVFCTDEINRRRNEPRPRNAGGQTTVFDARSGELLLKFAATGELRYSEPADLLVINRSVYRGKDGSLAWTSEKADQVLVTSDRLLSYGAGQVHDKNKRVVIHNLLTGETIGEDTEWFRRGCTTPRASANLLTTRYKGNAAHIDLASGRITSVWNVRAACSNNLFPANGVLALPDLTGGCTCNYMPISQGFVPSSAFK